MRRRRCRSRCRRGRRCPAVRRDALDGPGGDLDRDHRAVGIEVKRPRFGPRRDPSESAAVSSAAVRLVVLSMVSFRCGGRFALRTKLGVEQLQSGLHCLSLGDEIASTTRIGSNPARCPASEAARSDAASKTKKQISSSGTWIECSKETRVPALVSSCAAQRARRSRAARSAARSRGRYVSTR